MRYRPSQKFLVYDLAEYERLREECHLTQEQLHAALFGRQPALFGLVAGLAVLVKPHVAFYVAPVVASFSMDSLGGVAQAAARIAIHGGRAQTILALLEVEFVVQRIDFFFLQVELLLPIVRSLLAFGSGHSGVSRTRRSI